MIWTYKEEVHGAPIRRCERLAIEGLREVEVDRRRTRGGY